MIYGKTAKMAWTNYWSNWYSPNQNLLIKKSVEDFGAQAVDFGFIFSGDSGGPYSVRKVSNSNIFDITGGKPT